MTEENLSIEWSLADQPTVVIPPQRYINSLPPPLPHKRVRPRTAADDFVGELQHILEHAKQNNTVNTVQSSPEPETNMHLHEPLLRRGMRKIGQRIKKVRQHILRF